MRKSTSICFGAVLILAHSMPGVAAPELSDIQKAAIELSSRMSDQEWQEVIRARKRRLIAQPQSKRAQPSSNLQSAVSAPIEAGEKSGQKLFEIPILNRNNPDSPYFTGRTGCSGWIALLRQDWKDIGFASCPQSIAKANGAQATFTDDRVKNNVNWSLHGMGALLYNTSSESGYSSIGAYVTANRSINSAQNFAKTNIDTLGAGALYEFGWANGGYPYYANYFRVRGGAVGDNIKTRPSEQ